MAFGRDTRLYITISHLLAKPMQMAYLCRFQVYEAHLEVVWRCRLSCGKVAAVPYLWGDPRSRGLHT